VIGPSYLYDGPIGRAIVRADDHPRWRQAPAWSNCAASWRWVTCAATPLSCRRPPASATTASTSSAWPAVQQRDDLDQW